MGEEPKPKEEIFSIMAEEIPVLIGGDEQHSSDSLASRLVGTDGTEGMGSSKTSPKHLSVLGDPRNCSTREGGGCTPCATFSPKKPLCFGIQ